MASYNRVILVGNLTRDPELRYIPSGTAVSEIGLAVNDRVKKGDQWVDETTFVDVTLWARTAEVANEYLSKGSSVLIEGRLKLDSWEKDGQKRSKLRVVADKMQMLGGRSGGGSGGGGGGGGASRGGGYSQQSGGDEYSAPASYSQGGASAPPPEDDIPF
ncbi:Single-stranded DNA-binding protein [Pseudobythopirellula maris]|uniref:Single-stranded DNA-binding protein n=1 Tax=Pseudobythopirellula maris TaxID=2527991 RepID=A0A5C5ZMW2_9BACT|nr:single-stranded DNA-binding protein [Pseudobythopirellula maris]TWT88405.1 Single-stranded DNA-binding protein [Pseudobythopirellula maris]